MKIPQTLSSLSLPPGSSGFPVIGETFSFLTDPKFIEKRQKKYGSIFKTHLFGQPTIIALGAEANRFLLTHENQYFAIRWPRSVEMLLGPASLSVQQGTVHQQRRKLMAQAFQPRALTSYAPTMEQIARRYLDKWEQLGTLTWYPELRDYTLDVAYKLMVGIDSGSQTQMGEWFQTWTEALFTLPLPFPWTRFSRGLHSRKLLLAEIEKIIVSRQQEGYSEEDALSLLVQAQDEDGNSLSLDELKDQVLTLLFAGHETLTSALASFCRLLALHPEVLAKARAEQQQLKLEEPLTLENLKQMTYLDRVLKEVLRVTPPVGGGFREAIAPCEFDGYLIPQGWSVLYQIAKTHQNSNLYQQPESFDPDRFDAERAEDKSKPFAYLPFGGGVRECLGKEFAKLEMKIFAALLLRDYEWELLPEQNLELIRIPTPHPKDGLRVKFQRL